MGQDILPPLPTTAYHGGTSVVAVVAVGIHKSIHQIISSILCICNTINSSVQQQFVLGKNGANKIYF